MSQPHVPGTPDESAHTTGADGVSGASAQPAPAQRDERPRPQYGEYAPEGWTWQPPAGEHTSDPAPQMSAPPPPARGRWGAAAASGAPGAVPTATRAPSWDRVATIVLLVVGAFGAWSTAASMQQLAQQIRLSHTMLGIGEYTPPAWLPTLSVIGMVAQLALYAAVLLLSLVRLRARRIAFWIPLAGGGVSFLVTAVILAVVMLNDPTYLSFLESGGVPTAPPTP
ncbi:DUF6264 family protein [Agromyces bauzanensis]|uniref:Uncharacterized protein n=1 Tax=Agromyces bauzanensis TaxID=1308924 RepID=A0A917ULY8_9MICO|nr:DUF6264 family protein [Agromyces bauzanensis]GGJ66920.1 hypothetical protein GCM10011372_00880 [Agromyces bauzanensis]